MNRIAGAVMCCAGGLFSLAGSVLVSYVNPEGVTAAVAVGQLTIGVLLMLLGVGRWMAGPH